MKKALLPLLAGILFLGANGSSFAAVRQGIAAVVNDSIITYTDIQERTNLYASGTERVESSEELKQLSQQVLNRLIDEALQIQEARKLGIIINDKDVKAGFEEVARQNGAAPDVFKKRLVSAGAPIDSLYDQIKADISWSHVVRRKLRPQINISEGEIDLTVGQITNTSGKKRYQLAEIFLKVPSAAKQNDVRYEAQKIVEQLKTGASFQSIAREFSQAPGAASGGDLGWVVEGQLSPPLDKALKQMQPGQLSPPILAEDGYHILFLRDARIDSGLSANAAKAPVGETLVTMKQISIAAEKNEADAALKEKISRLKALKKELKSCEDFSKRMKDFPSPQSGDVPQIQQSQLPKEILDVVAPLKVGQVSPVIRNPAGLSVLMVCAREKATAATAGKPAATEMQREKIATNIGMQRLDQMAARYLRDLRATAFIDKRN